LDLSPQPKGERVFFYLNLFACFCLPTRICAMKAKEALQNWNVRKRFSALKNR